MMTTRLLAMLFVFARWLVAWFVHVCVNGSTQLIQQLQQLLSVLHLESWQGRLEALFRLKQVSKSWRTGKSGYEWQTEEDLVARGWQQKLSCKSPHVVHVRLYC